jgi:hydrogenase maturation protease
MWRAAIRSNPEELAQDGARESMGSSASEVLVLGLGNTLLGDDGVGVHVVRQLATDASAPPGLRFVDGGTLGFRLLETIAAYDTVLVVDAANFGEPAGTIRLLDFDALNGHIARGGRVSAHEAGLIDLIILAKLDGCLPARLAVLGIQPDAVDWDEGLSPAVAAALPGACERALDTARQWAATRHG